MLQSIKDSCKIIKKIKISYHIFVGIFFLSNRKFIKKKNYIIYSDLYPLPNTDSLENLP